MLQLKKIKLIKVIKYPDIKHYFYEKVNIGHMVL